MKAFIAAVICAAAIGVGGSYVLHTQQETVDVAFSTSAARVGDPGHNLVGMNWNQVSFMARYGGDARSRRHLDCSKTFGIFHSRGVWSGLRSENY